MGELATPQPRDVHHVRMCGGDHLYCGHPWQLGMWNLGDGELVVFHYHAPCGYQNEQEVWHEEAGYMGRAQILLQRSIDGGETWPEAENVVLYDRARPLEEQRAWLTQGEAAQELRSAAPTTPSLPRIDLTQPRSILVAIRAYTGAPFVATIEGREGLVLHENASFVLRSSDGGRTWDAVPTLLRSRGFRGRLATYNGYLRLPDGLVLMTLGAARNPASNPDPKDTQRCVLYATEDHGDTWRYLSTVAWDPHGELFYAYPKLVRLPSGRLLCTLGISDVPGGVRWTSVTWSDDDGLSWSAPQRMSRWGTSPYPVVLQDGRLLIVYAWRDSAPLGIRGKVSADEGRTWSEELVIRGDGGGWDLGYPVATQLPDGRIFTAYYFNVPDEVWLNRSGRRFIAGTSFRLD